MASSPQPLKIKAFPKHWTGVAAHPRAREADLQQALPPRGKIDLNHRGRSFYQTATPWPSTSKEEDFSKHALLVVPMVPTKYAMTTDWSKTTGELSGVSTDMP